MSVLLPIWSDKRETARRVKQRISAICRRVIVQVHWTDNPAGVVLDVALPRGDVKVQHLPALAYDEAAQCLATVKATRGASAPSKLALEFLILTAARSGEVCGVHPPSSDSRRVLQNTSTTFQQLSHLRVEVPVHLHNLGEIADCKAVSEAETAQPHDKSHIAQCVVGFVKPAVRQ